ncbi:MAG TPA: hypothetical protein VKA21_07745 [Candidatus Binatia bacterium]|nr:hypothetical protein [Candidatus Binatia bacterium]
MTASRVFCLVGAAVDALAAVALLSPSLSARMLGVGDVPVTPALLYAMRTAAALMIGWTGLLLWASARPVERGGVVVLTIVPVVAGLALTELAGVADGFVALANVAPLLVMQAALAAFGLWAWRRDRSGV